ncbi:helix-turn-helix transcriptional regulator [Corynebacterium mastitidis]|uniref:helix-turn-helix transcriptional regulator n=1 Tax=Corynebacterium mastitidis TaxID=161890 RepID=UPI0012EA0B84|nr:helix-turn-helix domain-containing protein [Corynebacterium mastitidis]
MTTTELIGSAEAGRLLGLSRNGVNRRVENGTLTPAGRIGRRGIHVFDRAEIERLAESEAK